MTAIAGFWSFGSRRDARIRCERMLEAQRIHGSGPASCWSDGAFALGRRLTSLLPEDIYDRGPIASADGRLQLTGDVRIDNREEMLRAFGLSPADGKRMSDSAIVLRAWESWQENALDRLVGDFSFAVWDASRQMLHLARDFIGHRPLCFFRGDGLFAFASMPKGLHALKEVPRAPDSASLRAWLAPGGAASGRTCFASIESVRPGEIVSVTGASLTRRSYWSPDLTPIRLKDQRDYTEAVCERFDAAVAAQLRGAGGRVAAHLSAGLDSSAVTATAARLLGERGQVVAFTAVPPAGAALTAPRRRIADEGALAAKTAAMYPNIEHVLVDGGGRSPLESLDRNFALYEAPVPGLLNHLWTAAIQDAAKARGLKVLLTGTAANFALSYDGTELLPQLLMRGRLLRLAQEWSGLASHGASLKSLAAVTIGAFVPQRLWETIQRQRGRMLAISDLSLVRGEVRQERNRVNLSERPERGTPAERVAPLQSLDPGMYYKGVLAGWGIDTRDPTADRRLVEFCLRVPIDRFLVRGTRRALAREAFADRLPEEVVSERRRGYQAADWLHTIKEHKADLRAEAQRIVSSGTSTDFIDTDRMLRLASELPPSMAYDAAAERLHRTALFRALSAGHFARKASGSNA